MNERPGGTAPMRPNEIEAVYMQHLNSGQFYLPQLGGPALSIDDWKARELERWVSAKAA